MVKVTCPEVDQIILDAGDSYYGPNDVDVNFGVARTSPRSAKLTVATENPTERDSYAHTEFFVEADEPTLDALEAVCAAVHATLQPVKDLRDANRAKRNAENEAKRLARVKQSTAPKVVHGPNQIVMPHAVGKTVAEVKTLVADVWQTEHAVVVMRRAGEPSFRPNDDDVIGDGDTIELVNVVGDKG